MKIEPAYSTMRRTRSSTGTAVRLQPVADLRGVPVHRTGTHGVLRRLRQSDLRAVRDNGIHDRVKSGELWNRERSLLRLSAEKAPHLASLSGLLPSLEKSALPPSGSGPPGIPREYCDGPGPGYSTVPPGELLIAKLQRQQSKLID